MAKTTVCYVSSYTDSEIVHRAGAEPRKVLEASLKAAAEIGSAAALEAAPKIRKALGQWIERVESGEDLAQTTACAWPLVVHVHRIEVV